MTTDNPRGSYHTHSHYCDGQGEIAEVVEAAIAAGLQTIGISSHAPLPFPTSWTMPPEQLPVYVAEVRALADRYRDQITVLLGAELDYIPAPAVTAFQEEQVHPHGFDYFVGSVHFLGRAGSFPPRSFDGTEAVFGAILREDYDGDIRRMAEDYYRRIAQVVTMPGVEIVGHFDLIKRWNAERRYFSGDEPWYREAADAALRTIAASGRIVELNTAGWRKELGEPYPTPWLLARCRELGIPVAIDSDSHTPGEVVAGFAEARELLRELRITPVDLPERSRHG